MSQYEQIWAHVLQILSLSACLRYPVLCYCTISLLPSSSSVSIVLSNFCSNKNASCCCSGNALGLYAEGTRFESQVRLLSALTDIFSVPTVESQSIPSKRPCPPSYKPVPINFESSMVSYNQFSLITVVK
jgi:hypothetical protein